MGEALRLVVQGGRGTQGARGSAGKARCTRWLAGVLGYLAGPGCRWLLHGGDECSCTLLFSTARSTAQAAVQ